MSGRLYSLQWLLIYPTQPYTVAFANFIPFPAPRSTQTHQECWLMGIPSARQGYEVLCSLAHNRILPSEKYGPSAHSHNTWHLIGFNTKQNDIQSLFFKPSMNTTKPMICLHIFVSLKVTRMAKSL